MAEAIEEYADTARDLARKWRHFSSHVADNLDSGYDADKASADLGSAVSLTIETSGRLAWSAVGTMAILLNRPGWVQSEKFSTALKGAKLVLSGPLANRAGQTVGGADVEVVPARLGPEETKFRIRVNSGACPAGIYRGTVTASLPTGQTEEVKVQIEVP
jgi:hypothetical protein